MLDAGETTTSEFTMPIRTQDYEKLGVFYLGREYDLARREPRDDLVLYDSKDLVTHAVIVGMTGSGKTGLGISLLEEAAIDGIPAIILDPKGDLANLLLTFPQLRPADFAPWINPEDARRKGQTVDEYAASQAKLWKQGLADWHQDGERIARLREAADICLFTPGSSAVAPVSIVQSFSAPDSAILDDPEAFRGRVSNAAASLLSLMGITDDPLQSREFILVSSILANGWKAGDDLDLAGLIHLMHTPPFERVGVMDLESFFPAKDRFAFAMRLNNLLASPGFEAWMEGSPLDVASMLHTREGKPKLTILSIAHLGDKERMFFVTLVLNQMLSWMRAQSGTSSLRAILYMDEIFGYFPPVANPPSKQPLLTMLKQARAYGLGVVLATQNPVDLDYKGLANTGTWFIGRLQTERDKARVLDGLEGASAATGSAFDRASIDQLLSGLGSRVFLLNNVHDDGPVLFQTRWALSYLRGPMTRVQLKQLLQTTPMGASEASEGADAAQAMPRASVLDAGARPVLPPGVPQFFLPPTTNSPGGAGLVYLPRILGLARVYFQDTRKKVDHNENVAFLAELPESGANLAWGDAAAARLEESDLEREPGAEARFGELPAEAAKGKSYDVWKKGFVDYLARDYALELLQCEELSETSAPGESERDFRVRLAQAAREERDFQAEKLRQKYTPKLASLEERVRKAQVAVEKEKSQASQSKLQMVLSFGSSIFGAFLGRKKLSVTNVNRAATAARSAGRTAKESKDVQYAEENVGTLQAQREELEKQFQEEIKNVEDRFDAATVALTKLAIKPKKTNIQVQAVALAWVPCWKTPDGFLKEAWSR